ncbi:hypothetical protein, partial [Faecalibaculum rodentium]|uniref:hypothetical protein n=1 Tax=Faecalibaculum rodentium TaxID=1702221 RepID=UPI0023F33CCB
NSEQREAFELDGFDSTLTLFPAHFVDVACQWHQNLVQLSCSRHQLSIWRRILRLLPVRF